MLLCTGGSLPFTPFTLPPPPSLLSLQEVSPARDPTIGPTDCCVLRDRCSGVTNQTPSAPLQGILSLLNPNPKKSTCRVRSREETSDHSLRQDGLHLQVPPPLPPSPSHIRPDSSELLRYDDNETLHMINDAITSVNSKALPDIQVLFPIPSYLSPLPSPPSHLLQGTLRSYSLSKEEIALTDAGELDVICGFSVIDNEMRMIVIEGLGGIGLGMQDVFASIPRRRENDKNLTILCNPEVLFPHRSDSSPSFPPPIFLSPDSTRSSGLI